MQTETFTKIQPVMAAALNVDAGEITPELQFGDLLQWDSMGHMELLMTLEAELGVEVSADTISELVSVALICEYIEKKNG